MASAAGQHSREQSPVNTSLSEGISQNPEQSESSIQNVEVSLTNPESSATRTSGRLKTKSLSKEILSDIDTLGSYHLSIVRELDTKEPPLEHSRLSQLYSEFQKAHSLQEVLKKFEQLKSISKSEEGSGSDSVQFREVLTACDRVSEDSKMICDRIEKAIQCFIVKPKSYVNTEDLTSNYSNKTVPSHKSKSISIPSRTHSSRSSTSSRKSSRASILLEMEINSRVSLAEMESKVEAEMATIQLEATLDELDKQKEQIKRSIRVTKAHGELQAERKKHAIIADAVDKELEEEQMSSLLHIPKQTSAEVPTLRDWTNPSFKRPANTNIVGTPSSQQSLQQPQIRSLDQAIQSKIQPNHDTEEIAQAITDYMHISLVAPPEPGKFNGNPLEYADWRVAFDSLIDAKRGTPIEKLQRLKNYVTGEAYEAISGYFRLHNTNAYKDALNTLQEEFGRDDLVEDGFRDKLESWPKIGPRDHAGLKKYSLFLKQCLAAQTAITSLKVLDERRENKKMIKALPDGTFERWVRKVTQEEKHGFPPFSQYVAFVAIEAKASTSRLREEKSTQNQLQIRITDQRQRTSFNTTATDSANTTIGTKLTRSQEIECAYCMIPYHDATVCRKLTAQTDEEKERFVRGNGLCYGCLKFGHLSNQCERRAVCHTCQKPHPTSMHQSHPTLKNRLDNTGFQRNAATGTQVEAAFKPQKDQTKESAPPKPSQKIEQDNKGHVSNNSTRLGTPRTSSMTLPVWITSKTNPEQEVLVYALLDTQSDSTYVVESVANKLSAKGKATSINLSTLTSQEETHKCMKLEDIQVRAFHTKETIDIKTAYTTKTIPAISEHIPTKDMVSKWPHLAEVANAMKHNPEEIPVGILIGYDTPAAFRPSQCISGKEEEPYAIETKLGWVIMGLLSEGKSSKKVSHKIVATDQQKHDRKEFDAVIKALSKDFDKVESREPVSMDDRKFLEILDKGIYQDNEGFITMPLPFKSIPQSVNSKASALHRFNILTRKFEKDFTYKDQYYKFMQDMVLRDEAEKVPHQEIERQSWYLPHFGVFHPKKPGKIRVVFDASAKIGKTCLNDYLLEGPAHINSLQGILLRFRKENIAIMCDIEKMFHNFRVTPRDRDFYRFLWFDETGKVTDYRMKVHIFGSKSSPGCATYGLRHLIKSTTASEAITSFVSNDFYVDDGLTSVENTQKAKELITEARQACKTGNLRLHKFVSNKSAVLEELPTSEKTENATKIDISSELSSDGMTERTLGLQWDIQEDTFKFTISNDNKPITRRGILSTVASLYDPLGFISPFILQGKMILQLLCKEGLDWDTPLEKTIHRQWAEWKQHISQLKHVSISRCYKPEMTKEITKAEIHNFSDASTMGYGQCSYLRLVENTGKVHISLIMSKSRVAPLKVVSIPRLELQAACTSIEVSKFLKEQLQLKDLKEYYWTDSKVVLAYLNNDARRFQVYVANRIQKIRDYSEPQQWSYVPTDHNPSDLASRGATPLQLNNSNWFQGPEFLHEEPIKLPNQGIAFDLNDNDPEVKRTVLSTQHNQKPLYKRLETFSQWNPALRGITRMKQQIRAMTKQEPLDPTTAKEKAKTIIIKSLQESYYHQDLKDLQDGKTVKRNSDLVKLCPIIDRDGVLRVGGRLQASSLSYQEKHPIILPKNAHISRLIIGFYHERTAHQGRGFTLARLRAAGYWITGAHQMVSSYIHHCIICRKDRGKILEQQMAPLLSDRTEAAPPFSYIGVDCFGPFTVKDGRKENKRWGLLTTCLASRAVHIEMLEDMTTDAFLNAFRSVTAIRGNVRQVRCDRGTNFTGAVGELGGVVDAGLKTLEVEFIFNPPHASHMGGVWERQIRTVRSIMKDVERKYGGRFSTSTLRVAMYEIMAIINSRPLGNVSEEDVPLTPNMLLTMKRDTTQPPPGKFEDSDIYSRKRWIQVQAIATLFWSRYRSEYLSQLQKRGKWTSPQRNLKVGDIVSMKEGNNIRNDWMLGKVVACPKSKDGLVRQVRVRVGKKRLDGKPVYLERPVTKLILLVGA